MEFGIDQTFNIYSGGLGFLAGSHMRSGLELKQNMIGVGMLWKYGYYDQARNEDQTLKAISNEPDNYYDLILVDSYPPDIKRISVANAVISKIKPGGYLVIDNYLKFGMENFKYPKSQIYTFDELHYSGLGTRICRLLK